MSKPTPAQQVLGALLEVMAEGVQQFQDKVLDLPVRPEGLTAERFEFRQDHMREELGEFMEAYSEENLAAQADALMDLIYVAFGTMLEMGLSPMDIYDSVQTANMQKLRGET